MNREELLKIAKPILFNTEMTQATLEDRKTATRRVIKPHPDEKHQFPLGFVTGSTDNKNIGSYGWGIDEYGGHIQYAKPPYKVGDILYVRETWRPAKKGYFYKADWEHDGIGDIGKWKPSIHMPKEAARLFLKVTDVRVERLQDITEEQAEQEGIRGYSKDGKLYKYAVSLDWWDEYHRKYTSKISGGTAWQDMPKNPWVAFMYLWDSTIEKQDLDKYGWEANPWVWVIEFERVEVQQ